MRQILQSEGIWQLILLALAMAAARLLHRLPLLRRIQLPDSLLAGLLLAVLYNTYDLPKSYLKPLRKSPFEYLLHRSGAKKCERHPPQNKARFRQPGRGYSRHSPVYFVALRHAGCHRLVWGVAAALVGNTRIFYQQSGYLFRWAML